MSAFCSVPYVVQQHYVGSVQCAIYYAVLCSVPYIVQHCAVCHIYIYILVSSMMSVLCSVSYIVQQHDVSIVQCAVYTA